jgi:hypothetical protein
MTEANNTRVRRATFELDAAEVRRVAEALGSALDRAPESEREALCALYVLFRLREKAIT